MEIIESVIELFTPTTVQQYVSWETASSGLAWLTAYLFPTVSPWRLNNSTNLWFRFWPPILEQSIAGQDDELMETS